MDQQQKVAPNSAKLIVKQLLASYIKPALDEAKEKALHAFMQDLAQKAGMEKLPLLEEFQSA